MTGAGSSGTPRPYVHSLHHAHSGGVVVVRLPRLPEVLAHQGQRAQPAAVGEGVGCMEAEGGWWVGGRYHTPS